MCDHKEAYIGKTVGNNVVGFKSRISQHISDCRVGASACKLPIHVYHCTIKNKGLKEPYFKLNIMMKLKYSRQLEFYQNHFHKNGYDTIDYLDYLKKTLKYIKLSLFSKITLWRAISTRIVKK